MIMKDASKPDVVQLSQQQSERFSGHFMVFLLFHWDENLFVGFTGTYCSRLSAARAHHLGGGRLVQRLGSFCGKAFAAPAHARFAGVPAVARRA